jgi:hypothetical protein
VAHGTAAELKDSVGAATLDQVFLALTTPTQPTTIAEGAR